MIVIPDVHGRTFWRQAVNEYLGKEHILFLGDYLDPYTYEGITPTDAYTPSRCPNLLSAITICAWTCGVRLGLMMME